MNPSAAQKHPDCVDDPCWGIQEFAEEFDVTPRTIRFYESKGLLSPERQAGSRIFGAQDHLRLTEIMRAKRLGFSLEDIKTVMDVIDGKVRDKAALRTQKDNFEIVIKNLRRRRKDIDTLTADLTNLCERMDTYIQTAPDNAEMFEFAEAYHDAFRRHLPEDGFETHSSDT